MVTRHSLIVFVFMSSIKFVAKNVRFLFVSSRWCLFALNKMLHTFFSWCGRFEVRNLSESRSANWGHLYRLFRKKEILPPSLSLFLPLPLVSPCIRCWKRTHKSLPLSLPPVFYSSDGCLAGHLAPCWRLATSGRLSLSLPLSLSLSLGLGLSLNFDDDVWQSSSYDDGRGSTSMTAPLTNNSFFL